MDYEHAYDRRVEDVRHLVRMLFAMNRRYFRKAKALDRLVAGFGKCPESFWRRLLDGLGEQDHMRAGAKLLALAGEMIDLIEPPELLERREHWRAICSRWAEEYGVA